MIFYLTKQLGRARSSMLEGIWRDKLGPNIELYGKNLGIVGNGEIGQSVAALGRALGMNILISDKQGVQTDTGFPIEEVLNQSDIVTLHLPATPDNTAFFNRERIYAMKRGALLINTSRGSILDYSILEEALASGQLGGLGLDVYPDEPVREPLPSYLTLSNVICTPHHAYYADNTIARMNHHLIHNALRFLQQQQS
nr:NAD(P)-dependent oxidoreductase [Paenibacillus oenotherae]